MNDISETNLKQRYKSIRFVTIVGALVNIILAVLKIIIGKIAFSHALLVDGIHSLSALLSDALVLYASKKASIKPDNDHPYGHARIETFFTVIFGIILILVGVGIIYDAIERLYQHEEIQVPLMEALVVAFISVVSKEVLYQYTQFYAKKLHSSLLKANAWHHRSDAVSSIVVLIGVAGGMYGLPYLDSVAAVIVAMMIVKIGWDLMYESANELVDKGVDKEELREITESVEKIPDVVHMHSLRTRHMGGKILVDVHVQVEQHISVSEGHRIADEVHYFLRQHFEKITEVLVHIDPEDDEAYSSCAKLPLRHEIQSDLYKLFENNIINIKELLQEEQKLLTFFIDVLQNTPPGSLALHYSNGKVSMEIFFPLALLIEEEKLDALQTWLSVKVCSHLSYLQLIRFVFVKAPLAAQKLKV